jgi:hypothetical protein
MFNFAALAADCWPLLFAATGIARFWYAVPLITSVSLVCAATRHEDMRAILVHALRFALWVLIFMGIVLGGIQLLTWWQ